MLAWQCGIFVKPSRFMGCMLETHHCTKQCWRVSMSLWCKRIFWLGGLAASDVVEQFVAKRASPCLCQREVLTYFVMCFQLALECGAQCVAAIPKEFPCMVQANACVNVIFAKYHQTSLTPRSTFEGLRKYNICHSLNPAHADAQIQYPTNSRARF